jgi:hypothetical protein
VTMSVCMGYVVTVADQSSMMIFYSRSRVGSARHIRWAISCADREATTCSYATGYCSGDTSYMLVGSRFCKVSQGSNTRMRSFARIGMRSEGGACCSLLIYDHRTVFRVSIMKESGWNGGGNVPFAKADVEGNLELKLERRKLGEQRRQDFTP